MKSSISASLQQGQTFVLCTRATLADAAGIKKLGLSKKVAEELKGPFYYVLAKANVVPSDPNIQKYYVHIVFESSKPEFE